MVEVRYRDNLGNNLFQYCLGRIIAESLGFRLKANYIEGFPNTRKKVDGNDYSEYPAQIFRGQTVDLKSILADKSKRKIILDGWFQRYEYYKDFKEAIKKDWLITDILLKKEIKQDDIVVGIRGGDYRKWHSALPFSYYEEALSLAEYEQVFICTDDTSDPFLRKFKKYKPIIYKTDVLDNFKSYMSFNKIVLSQSTFHWWAAFLSNAKEIYAPIPLEGFGCVGSHPYPDIDLRVDDENRYKYIKCKETYRESFSEKMIRLGKRIRNKASRTLDQIATGRLHKT